MYLLLFIYVVNFAYGWVIVSLVIDSGNPSICDPNIYLNAKLVIIVIQVVQSLCIAFACFYLAAVCIAMVMVQFFVECLEQCCNDFCKSICRSN